jgi:hypothetical protein
MRESKWLWILTFVNVAIAATLFLGIRAMLFALGALAPFVSVWPLAVLVFAGFAFSLIGVLLAKRTNPPVPRRVGFIVNGSALALHAIVIVGIAATLVGIRSERFLIPEGYMGDIYVIHSVADGEPEMRTFTEVTYRIPRDGVLRTKAPMIRGLTRTTYYYVRDDGVLSRIRYEWLTAIPGTPENLTNNKDLGIFFPRSGKQFSTAQKCAAEFQLFYVGTKAYLLSTYQPMDLSHYLSGHPIDCATAPPAESHAP